MFYVKKILTKSSSAKTLKYNAFKKGLCTNQDDNILPHQTAKLFYNYSITDGSLRNGLGFSECQLPVADGSEVTRNISPIYDSCGGIHKLWFCNFYSSKSLIQTNYLFCHGYDNKFYSFRVFSPLDSKHPLLPVRVMENPIKTTYTIYGRDVIIFTSPTDNMIVVDVDRTEEFPNAPKMVSMCIHYDRLFAIVEGTRKRLMYSANLDPTNWDLENDDAGYIEMADERGRLCKVISFNDYIYVFRENGITKVSAYGSQNSYNVTHLFVTNAKIYENTVTVCENKVVFLSRAGLHVFNGAAATKLELGLDDLLNGVYNNKAEGAYWKGKYYLACKLNFNDGEVVGCESGEFVNNALIEIDLKTEEVNITRGIDISSLCPVEDGNASKLLATFRGEKRELIGQLDDSGSFFGQPLKKVWVSAFSNLGQPDKLKIVKEFFIETQDDVCVKIKSESQERSYKVKGKNAVQRIRANVKGKKIQVSFVSEGSNNVKISCPEITVGVI